MTHHDQPITAKYARVGNLITDELGQQYRVERREDAPGGAGVYLWRSGQGYPEFYVWDHKMTRTTYVPDPKPFKVYTRTYLKNGDCRKRIHEFATREAQSRFIGRTNLCVTFYN